MFAPRVIIGAALADAQETALVVRAACADVVSLRGGVSNVICSGLCERAFQAHHSADPFVNFLGDFMNSCAFAGDLGSAEDNCFFEHIPTNIESHGFSEDESPLDCQSMCQADPECQFFTASKKDYLSHFTYECRVYGAEGADGKEIFSDDSEQSCDIRLEDEYGSEVLCFANNEKVFETATLSGPKYCRAGTPSNNAVMMVLGRQLTKLQPKRYLRPELIDGVSEHDSDVDGAVVRMNLRLDGDQNNGVLPEEIVACDLVEPWDLEGESECLPVTTEEPESTGSLTTVSAFESGTEVTFPTSSGDVSVTAEGTASLTTTAGTTITVHSTGESMTTSLIEETTLTPIETITTTSAEVGSTSVTSSTTGLTTFTTEGTTVSVSSSEGATTITETISVTGETTVSTSSGEVATSSSGAITFTSVEGTTVSVSSTGAITSTSLETGVTTAPETTEVSSVDTSTTVSVTSTGEATFTSTASGESTTISATGEVTTTDLTFTPEPSTEETTGSSTFTTSVGSFTTTAGETTLTTIEGTTVSVSSTGVVSISTSSGETTTPAETITTASVEGTSVSVSATTSGSTSTFSTGETTVVVTTTEPTQGPGPGITASESSTSIEVITTVSSVESSAVSTSSGEITTSEGITTLTTSEGTSITVSPTGLTVSSGSSTDTESGTTSDCDCSCNCRLVLICDCNCTDSDCDCVGCKNGGTNIMPVPGGPCNMDNPECGCDSSFEHVEGILSEQCGCDISDDDCYCNDLWECGQDDLDCWERMWNLENMGITPPGESMVELTQNVDTISAANQTGNDVIIVSEEDFNAMSMIIDSGVDLDRIIEELADEEPSVSSMPARRSRAMPTKMRTAGGPIMVQDISDEGSLVFVPTDPAPAGEIIDQFEQPEKLCATEEPPTEEVIVTDWQASRVSEHVTNRRAIVLNSGY